MRRAEEQIGFVHEYPRLPPPLLVLKQPVVDGIKDNQHAQRLHGAAQIADLKGDETGLEVNVGLLGKGIHGTDGIKLQIQRQCLRFRFGLLQQHLVQIL